MRPGAEEFLPPADNGIWLPPQRTFSSLTPARRSSPPNATTHIELEVERDIPGATLSVRAFRETVDDQLVTLFGVDVPVQPTADSVTTSSATAATSSPTGCSAGFERPRQSRAAARSRIRSSTRCSRRDSTGGYLSMARACGRFGPSASAFTTWRRPIEADVPETATRVLVLYRVEQRVRRRDGPTHGLSTRASTCRSVSRCRFMDFRRQVGDAASAVRNFFRETASRPVGLRRTARCPSPEADRGRRDDALLAAGLRSVHNIESDSPLVWSRGANDSAPGAKASISPAFRANY